MKIAVSTYQTLWWFSNSNIGVPPECFHASSWNSIPWFWKCNCHWVALTVKGSKVRKAEQVVIEFETKTWCWNTMVIEVEGVYQWLFWEKHGTNWHHEPLIRALWQRRRKERSFDKHHANSCSHERHIMQTHVCFWISAMKTLNACLYAWV